MKAIVVVFALAALIGSASAQTTAEQEIISARAVCRDHRGTGTGAPGHANNWMKGWESCENIEAAYQQSEAGKAERAEIEERMRQRVQEISRGLLKQ